MTSPKTILVTGGAGFLGTNLSRLLLERGDHVIVLDNLMSGMRDNIDGLQEHENLRFIDDDILNLPAIQNDIPKLDEIYHLACPASPPMYQKDPINTWEISTFGTSYVAKLALRDTAKLLFTSTSEVYGDPDIHPQTEAYRGNVNIVGPRACYDEGKRAAETLLMDYHRQHDLPIRIVRIFNTYGPHMDPNDGRVVSNFICQALRGENLTIYGDGQQTRSFCYVDDLVNGLVAMMDNDKDFLGPVNIGNPGEFTIEELAKLVISQINAFGGKPVELVYKDLPVDDPKMRRPNNDLARETLGWSPKIPLQEGLSRTIPWFQHALDLSDNTAPRMRTGSLDL